MKRFRLDDTEDHVSEDAVANGTRLVPAGSVLLLARGMTLLNDLPICVIGRPMTFNQDVKALRPKPHVRGDYLPYLLLGNKERLLSLVDLAGHGTGRLNSDELKALDVPLPPLPEQHAIAHILGTLDDKIDLNRRMNETLEAMARTLFKSWFVDFDPVRARAEGRDPGMPQTLSDLFPDSFEESELGEIPRGWSVGRLRDAVEHLRDQENPLSSPNVLFHHFSIPAFDEGQSPKVEHGESIKSLKWRVPTGVVLLSKLNPEIERVWLVDVRSDERSVCSTEFLVLGARHPFTRSFVYCLARSPLFRQQIQGLVTGTSKSHQRAQVASILDLPVVVPSSPVVAAFDRLAHSLLERTLECRREGRTLSKLRNALLPKLISGELRMKDLGRICERAGA
jgi:type I restriction enzyme S subunit